MASITRPGPVVAGTGACLPAHVYSQAQLAALAGELLGEVGASPAAVARLFRAVGVEQRHLALPVARYRALDGFADRCAAWLDVALELGERAIRAALADAGPDPAGTDPGQGLGGGGGVDPAELALLVSTTVTGFAVPSVDARLFNRIGFAPTLKRVPLFGLGCVGGAAGLARVADYLRGHPDQLALLLSVELCSLTFRREDSSVANLISTGLFGDGAAAVLVAGAEHPLAAHARPRVLDSCAALFPETERMMGWAIVDRGFKIVLDPAVPDLVARELPGLVDSLLAAHGLTRSDIAAWIAHPGGPKVIAAVQRGLGLRDEQIAATREGLARVGNLSSASVLFLLDEFRRERAPAPGSYGLLFALGPGFCAELVLLRW
jgi:alkylresorcinol/alkylpyrone synthase